MDVVAGFIFAIEIEKRKKTIFVVTEKPTGNCVLTPAQLCHKTFIRQEGIIYYNIALNVRAVAAAAGAYTSRRVVAGLSWPVFNFNFFSLIFVTRPCVVLILYRYPYTNHHTSNNNNNCHVAETTKIYFVW